jgi:RNA polymerase sigma-70 factor, ECF subfamily
MDPSALEDIHLMGRVRAGDREAFARLFDRHAPAVLGLLVRILGSRSEAEEVLQEVFLQTWRQAGRYEPGRATPRGWLLVLARSRALDVVRSREARRRREMDLATDPSGVAGSAVVAGNPGAPAATLATTAPLGTERLEADERRRQVHSALDRLPDEQRRCIELAYFEGLSQSQIAQRLDAPLGTVKSRIHLGMSKLREALQS